MEIFFRSAHFWPCILSRILYNRFQVHVGTTPASPTWIDERVRRSKEALKFQGKKRKRKEAELRERSEKGSERSERESGKKLGKRGVANASLFFRVKVLNPTLP